VLGDQLVDERGQGRAVPLAGHLCDDVAARVDQDQRRPGPGGVRVPGDEVGVVEHRMLHAVAADRVRDGLRPGLARELRGVHPEHGERVAVALLEHRQLVEHPQPVHAARGPEVDQHDPAAQLRRAHVPAAGAQPAPPAQRRRPYPRSCPHSRPNAAPVRAVPA